MEARMKLYQDEIKDAGRELMVAGMKLRSPHDRVKMCQWLKKLSELRNDKLSEVTMRHEYLQYLRMTLQGDYQLLTKPFNTPPPDDELVPFAECIANKTADAIPDVPRAGKLQPVLCHKSEDDRAFMCIKRTPDNGILCYMAVAPDSNAMQQGE